jgi:integrase/recombinase XerC
MKRSDLELITINEAANQFISQVIQSRSKNTGRTYQNAMSLFISVLENKNIPASQPITQLNEDSVIWYMNRLKDFSSATERLYMTVIAIFFEFLAASNYINPNLHRIRLLMHQRTRRSGQRLPQFPANDIEYIIKYANNIVKYNSNDINELLINMRDRAFLVTLADTGLRVHEACNLRRGDIDWFEGKAMIIGKGDQQNVVRFSARSLSDIKDYINIRSVIDGASGKPLATLPLFARHDRGAGKKVKPITTTTGRNIVAARVKDALGEKAVGTITPHSFRHYFVTMVLRGSGGNLKLAQELARHKNIAVTQRYAHLSNDELDQGYHEIFG